MAEIIQHRCPGCGAPLAAAAAATTRCDHCGAEVEIRRDGTDPGQAAPSELDRELVELLRSGQTIPAIKRLRQATGVGLKEAKERVEQLARQHGIAARSGCALAALGVVTVVALACGALAALL